MMLQERYGVRFDYDQRNGSYLVAMLDSSQSKQLVSHQVQMLLNNQIPQLLKMELDHNNDTYQLQYDLTAKKRLFQVLQSCPLTITMFYEVAFRLIQTIANSSMYMLNENQYVLHSDFIYCGRDAADLYVCYLPIPSIYAVSTENQLRLLLLRMLAQVDGFIGEINSNNGLTKIMSILHNEDYNITELKDVLKAAWMKHASITDPTLVNKEYLITEQTNQSKKPIWMKIKSMWRVPKKLESQITISESKSSNDTIITGVTAMLVNNNSTLDEEIKIIINKHGTEQLFHFNEERFIIGRNQAGVHYMDTTEGISRVHCEFTKTKDHVEVKDLGSLNGSYLNGEMLIPYKTYPFKFGDILRIVTTDIRVTI